MDFSKLLRSLRNMSLNRLLGNLTVRTETEGNLMRKITRMSPSRKTVATKKLVQENTVLSVRNTVVFTRPTILGTVGSTRKMGLKRKVTRKKVSLLLITRILRRS